MFSSERKKTLQDLFGDHVEFDYPLKSHTSIRIGGPADAFVSAQTEEELKNIMQWVRKRSVRHFVIGKGSNTLVLDGGFRGVVTHLGQGFNKFEKKEEQEGCVLVEAQGGVPTQQLVRWCAMEGLAGLERLAGVPGTIGGNVMMNAGTHLGEIGELLEEVRLIDAKGEEKVLTKGKLKFAYRESNIPPSSIVTSAVLKLKKGDREKVEKTIREVFERRGESQPVDIPNLGSVFKNPKGKKAWELIEEAGLKGVRVGQARVSERHANFIVNEGDATANDVLVLMQLIKDKVKKMFDIQLEREIKVIGEGV